MRISLHNHSNRCDGECSPEEIVCAALEGGLSHVAITDHFDTEKLRPIVGITPEAMADYVNEVRDLAERYADRITVLVAVEIDFSRERTPFHHFATAEQAEETFGALDFVLFEYVQNPHWQGEGLHTFLDLRGNIPLPVGLAHPDIMMTFYGLLPGAAAGVLAQSDVFLELCPSPRNAVLDLAGRPSPEQIEEDTLQVGLAIEEAKKKLEKDPNNPYLHTRLDELHLEIDELHAQGEWVPPYRISNSFMDDFFDAVRERGVLLSIGPDSHGHGTEVTDIDDAVDFVEEMGLSQNIITAHLWQG